MLFVSTAFLVAVFLFFCAGAWRIYNGRADRRPRMERAAMVVVFGLVGWQALMWLRADQTGASQARVIGVWVQLLSAFGVAGLMLLYGWLPRRINSR